MIPVKKQLDIIIELRRPEAVVVLPEQHNGNAFMRYTASTCIREVNANIIIKFHELWATALVSRRGKMKKEVSQLVVEVPVQHSCMCVSNKSHFQRSSCHPDGANS